MKKVILSIVGLASPALFASQYAPETWFHIIDGNASKEGIAADIEAIAEAGIGGIQFFHGGWGKGVWPGVKEPVPCLSEKWTELVKFAETECHKRGLTFKMQNCPGWSMSGGPWITPDKAMRKLVAFEPGKMPKWNAADDFREIGTVTFPWGGEACAAVRTVTFPNPRQIDRNWPYEPDAELVVCKGDREIFRRNCPTGSWYDVAGMTFDLGGAVEPGEGGGALKAEVRSRRRGTQKVKVSFGREIGRLDNWEGKAGWALRSFAMSTNAASVRFDGTKTLVFGHVNAKRRNSPAPKEATGWECDKMDPRGFEANWNGYLGKLVKAGVKIDGTLVDSWECGCQTWTWKMEEEFEKRNGYALRPWLPALFGYVLKSEAETEKFLLDWRNTCSRLIEENYYGTIARLARENGMTVQYETAFGDVIPGDILRYWKYADEPMCEFWSPFDNDGGFVYSHDFKSVRPCVSAAHVYGKKRVSAEAFTSFKLTYNETFQELKENANRHFARGVTHLVFHTYTHNPVVTGQTAVASMQGTIGTPFNRVQPWWPYMREFTRYLENCCRELERGLPVVDILWYLGDDVNHKPSERDDLFNNQYKYDYCNNDALMTRVDVKDGRLVFPDGMSYRVLWLPKGTFLLPATEAKLAELEKKGARVIRGDFTPDWPSPLEMTGIESGIDHWYQRRDGDEDIFFLSGDGGRSEFMHLRNGNIEEFVDAVTRRPVEFAGERHAVVPVKQASFRRYLADAILRAYDYTFESASDCGHYKLNLGDVRSWATVFVNDREVARLWCPPYACDISDFVKSGENRLRIEVTSTIYNQLVLDAVKPKAERKTWTLGGPKAGAPLVDAGLYGPVTLKVVK